jgi:hypothetical protein
MPKKVVAINRKPSARGSVTPDEWVAGGSAPSPDEKPAKKEQPKSATTRYTIDIPVELHARIKSWCAVRRVKMNEEVVALLERHFSE